MQNGNESNTLLGLVQISQECRIKWHRRSFRQDMLYLANKHYKPSHMGQSLVKNYVHIVFSTKNRFPLIHQPVESELHAYIGGICNQLDCHTITVGGYTDHVHILCSLSKKIALMKLVEKIKSNSSRWIKTNDPTYRNFAWQNGYGAFSLSPSQVDKVTEYIKNQHEHHRKKTFQEEYRSLLIENEMEYDERYVWD